MLSRRSVRRLSPDLGIVDLDCCDCLLLPGSCPAASPVRDRRHPRLPRRHSFPRCQAIRPARSDGFWRCFPGAGIAATCRQFLGLRGWHPSPGAPSLLRIVIVLLEPDRRTKPDILRRDSGPTPGAWAVGSRILRTQFDSALITRIAARAFELDCDCGRPGLSPRFVPHGTHPFPLLARTRTETGLPPRHAI